jgi:hypothetical protein
MAYADIVEKWIIQLTARSLDQHAADPIPAAAHLPASADQLRICREHLLMAVDSLRADLINGDDLNRSAQALLGALSGINGYASDYESARMHIERLLDDPDRRAYVAANPVRPVQRRYVNPGDMVLIVLPHTEVCRNKKVAGQPVWVQINEDDITADPTNLAGPMRLPHAAAGIYRDPVESRLYTLRSDAASH